MSLEITGVIIFGLAGVLIAAPFLVRRHLAVRERAVAGKLGFSFQPRLPEELHRRLLSFELIRSAEQIDIFNLLFRADPERQFAAFTVDQHTLERSTVNRVVKVFLAASESFALPRFKLVPKNLSHRIDREPDINFPESPVFSRRFLLQGEPEDRVRALFSPRLREYLQGRREMVLEGRDNCLIIIDPRAKLPRLIREGMEIATLIEAPESMENAYRAAVESN